MKIIKCIVDLVDSLFIYLCYKFYFVQYIRIVTEKMHFNARESKNIDERKKLLQPF